MMSLYGKSHGTASGAISARNYSGIMHIFDSTFYTRVKDGCRHGGYTARFHDLGHWLPIVQHLRVLMGACSRSSSSSFKTLSKIL